MKATLSMNRVFFVSSHFKGYSGRSVLLLCVCTEGNEEKTESVNCRHGSGTEVHACCRRERVGIGELLPGVLSGLQQRKRFIILRLFGFTFSRQLDADVHGKMCQSSWELIHSCWKGENDNPLPAGGRTGCDCSEMN